MDRRADEAAEAQDGIAVAAALLARFEVDGSEAHLFQAIELLNRSAGICERLGRIDRLTQSVDYLEAAVNLFLASGSETARPCLDVIADILESELGDSDAARAMRNAISGVSY
jgi:hypothetical protein